MKAIHKGGKHDGLELDIASGVVWNNGTMLILAMKTFVALSAIGFFCAWLWAMWVAFTQGDDAVARLGRRILGRAK